MYFPEGGDSTRFVGRLSALAAVVINFKALLRRPHFRTRSGTFIAAGVVENSSIPRAVLILGQLPGNNSGLRYLNARD